MYLAVVKFISNTKQNLFNQPRIRPRAVRRITERLARGMSALKKGSKLGVARPIPTSVMKTKNSENVCARDEKQAQQLKTSQKVSIPGETAGSFLSYHLATMALRALVNPIDPGCEGRSSPVSLDSCLEP
jgi:hypothetical protein